MSPENVEKVYQACPLVSQIFITGRLTESYLVAIIVPAINKLKELVGQNEEVKINQFCLPFNFRHLT